MSIGKNSILRVQNAEKNGAAPIVTLAPDMENSTPVPSLEEKEPTKKAPAKKASAKTAPKTTDSSKTTIKKQAPKRTVRKAKTNLPSYCAIGDEMPIYLL